MNKPERDRQMKTINEIKAAIEMHEAELHYIHVNKPEKAEIAFEIYYETGEKPTRTQVEAIYFEMLAQDEAAATKHMNALNELQAQLDKLTK